MQIKAKYGLLMGVSFLLAACGSNPQSYIQAKKAPIINIESELDEQLKVEAEPDYVKISNQQAYPVKLAYKLFWYDAKGVSQISEDLPSEIWQLLSLAAHQQYKITLVKPTAESVNYRVYLKK